MGRLTADPEIRQTNSGKTVASYRMAVDRNVKSEGQPEADFINCTAWGKTGEFAEKYLRKGMKIAIEGRIQTGSYEKDGVKHYTTDIIVDRHEFCEGKRSADSGSYPAPDQGFTEIEETDGELPF
jgi:single-strand DNA-binding protein